MQTVRLSLMAVAATLALGATAAQAASYEIDPAHTHTTFEIGHFGTNKRSEQTDLTNPRRAPRSEGEKACWH